MLMQQSLGISINEINLILYMTGIRYKLEICPGESGPSECQKSNYAPSKRIILKYFRSFNYSKPLEVASHQSNLNHLQNSNVIITLPFLFTV